LNCLYVMLLWLCLKRFTLCFLIIQLSHSLKEIRSQRLSALRICFAMYKWNNIYALWSRRVQRRCFWSCPAAYCIFSEWTDVAPRRQVCPHPSPPLPRQESRPGTEGSRWKKAEKSRMNQIKTHNTQIVDKVHRCKTATHRKSFSSCLNLAGRWVNYVVKYAR